MKNEVETFYCSYTNKFDDIERFKPILDDFVDCCKASVRKSNEQESAKKFSKAILTKTITEFEIRVHFDNYEIAKTYTEKEMVNTIIKEFATFLYLAY